MESMWFRWGQWGAIMSLAVLLGAGPAGAQDAEPAADAAEEATQPAEAPADDLVDLADFKVVGSRLPGRSAADAPVPVDVIDAESFKSYGIRDMNNLLAATVPSYNVSQHAIGDQNALVRPAKLRGLPPDSTLVLINGKRRHRSSAITTWSWGLARGAHGPDIASIPAIALKRVEVLRDGAAAQYGSDAVAGVLNFVLRDAPNGGTIETRLGQYYHGDGDLANVAANVGLPLTDAGFANLSFEFTNSDSTNRSVQRDDASRMIANGNDHIRKSPVQAWGAPDVKYDYKFFGNFGLDLGDDHHAYAFGGYAEREIEDSWYWRSPASFGQVFADPADSSRLLVGDLTPDGMSGNCPTIPVSDYVQNGPSALAPLEGNDNCYALAQRFPGGFTPRYRGKVNDWSIAFGLRGTLRSNYALLDGWEYDMSGVFGQHNTETFLRNSVNPNLLRMKAAIPTEYKVREYEERDKTFNLDLSRPFDLGLFYSPLNVAFGLEYREEEYEIFTGEPNSYFRDDLLANQGFLIGVSGQQGAPPKDATEANRASFGAYLDLEANVIKQVLVNAAGRFEHHEGVGESLDGKLAARWDLLEDFLALRGSIGTGFRAPTVGQANFRTTTTSVDDEGNLAETSTLPPDDPIARQKGATPLSPEHSTSFSVGAVLTLGDLSVTADYYNIEVRSRIALSPDFSLDASDRAALTAAGIDVVGVGQVSYFTNDFGTTTQGVDLVATYPLEWFGGKAGRTQFTGVANWNNTKIDSRGSTVTDVWEARIEEQEPEFRFSLTADHTWGAWRLLSRLHYYDDFNYESLNAYRMYSHARALLDLELSYTFFDAGLTVAAGAQNLFDTYPTRNPHSGAYGEKYPVISPYGFNGGFYYLRAGFEWF